MELMFESKEMEGVARGRESFSGRLRTDDEFFEVTVLGGICEREIRKSGSFKTVRNSCCIMLSSARRMNNMQAESAINDIFKERTGMTMNVMREGLKARLAELNTEQKQKIGEQVSQIEPMMQDGTLLRFDRVLSHVSAQIAKELNVTELGITNVMADEFRAANDGKDLNEWGKDLDKKIYQPQVEELKKAREAERSQTQRQTGSYSHSR